MNSNLTEIVFILDRSGSMHGLEADTIGGYNSFLENQKKEEGETLVTTVLFDDEYELLYNGVAINSAKLTSKQYFVRGCTALLDAVGKTIIDIKRRIANKPENQRPSKVIFVITTDGMENASTEFTKAKVKELITHQQEMENWEFLFFGANIDSASTAESIGINAEDAIDFEASSAGVKSMMAEASSSVSERRRRR